MAVRIARNHNTLACICICIYDLSAFGQAEVSSIQTGLVPQPQEAEACMADCTTVFGCDLHTAKNWESLDIIPKISKLEICSVGFQLSERVRPSRFLELEIRFTNLSVIVIMAKLQKGFVHESRCCCENLFWPAQGRRRAGRIRTQKAYAVSTKVTFSYNSNPRTVLVLLTAWGLRGGPGACYLALKVSWKQFILLLSEAWGGCFEFWSEGPENISFHLIFSILRNYITVHAILCYL